ncbi:MAG: DUF4838 domain-containing protein [Armatimonadetes bacterium]|nr:DUF4838 domain-containing protein [Armatimonadota bacterium]
MRRDAFTLGLIGCLLAGEAAAAPPSPTTRLVLVRAGKPASTILLARKPTRAAQFAAYELQWHVQQMTGARLPIRHEGAPVTGTRILVGQSAATDALGIRAAALGRQEYVIRLRPASPAPTLVLLGRDRADYGTVRYDPTPDAETLATWPSIWDEQGTLHAVYEFLERFCGVRWFNPTESGTVIPRTRTLVVSVSELRRAPSFRYRFAAYPNSEDYDLYTGLWPAGSEGYREWEAAAYPELHRRFPESNRYRLAKRGWVSLFRYRMREGGERCVANHSLYGYYKRFWEKDPALPEVFEGRRPELFAQGYEGTPPQMCYSSRALVEQVAQDARDYFDGKGLHPHSLQPLRDRNESWGDNYFCVEPMDNAAFCKCPRCREWLPASQPFDPFFTNGLHSDYFFNFVNEVAKEVRKTHPRKWIVTLAYMTHGAHPKRVKLEPNVAVQFCFACNRLNYDRASYEHEIALLREWAKEEKGRPLYLWLYYTFPVEIANGNRFHCFPGFFAHAIGEQFRLFRECGIRGMFHCGYGQDVEAYLTYQLMEDASLDVDALLDDYFRGLYGAAAAPMKRLYLAIEQTYSNPANYPEAIASGRKEGHHHQTEEIAWGWLGTEQRMAEFGKLLAQAKAAARTAEEKHRVALFEKSTWNYMVAGRQLYQQHMKERYGGEAGRVRAPFLATTPLAGDATRLVREEAAVLGGWRSRTGERTARQVEARLANDGTYLYLQLVEQTDPRRLRAATNPRAGDHWQVILAGQRGRPYRELLVGPEGTFQGWQTNPDAGPLEWESGARVVSDRSRPNQWTTSISLPLDRLLPGGVSAGGSVYLNLARRSPGSDDEPVWVPTFGEFHDPERLREVRLDGPETIPAALPTTAELSALRTEGLVGYWRLDEGAGAMAGDSSPNALQGTLANGAGWVQEGGRSVLRLDDRQGQYVELGNADAVNLTGPLTLEAWVKYAPSEMWYPAILGKGYEQTGAYSLHLRPGLTLWFELDGEDGKRYHYNPTDLAIVPDAWTHVVATWDGAMMRVYINGREAGTGMEAALTIRKTAEPLRIGWLGSYGYFNGCLRDVALYRRAFSPGEVYARYQAGR